MLKNPKMGNLPGVRIEPSERPFTYVGVDVCGPFKVIVRRTPERRWVMIFTCLATRAIHLEVINEMSADRCLIAIQDFKNIRGPAQHFYSDCGTNFEGAMNKYNDELRKMLPSLTPAVAAKYKIHWHFNPARTPHWGGVWERLIRTLKTCLKATMLDRPRLFTPDALRSALLEIMNKINSRPLTEISIDHEDEPALTPNHFLFGTDSNTVVPGIFTDKDECSKSMYRRARHLANQLWARWVREYVPILMNRSKLPYKSAT